MLCMSPLAKEIWRLLNILSLQAVKLKVFPLISTVLSYSFLTDFSLTARYWIKSAIDPIFNLCSWANCIRSSLLAIVPSSFIISQITPAGSSPASFDKSHAASVCPALLRTPPSMAFNGKICPGCTISLGFEFFATAVFIVWDLSAADIPVVIPLAASIDTVKAVPWLALFFSVIIGRSKWEHLLEVRVKQMRPLPFDAIKLTISGLTSSAAQTKSPSFSRSSSSSKITILPSAISFISSSTVLNSILSSC